MDCSTIDHESPIIATGKLDDDDDDEWSNLLQAWSNPPVTTGHLHAEEWLVLIAYVGTIILMLAGPSHIGKDWKIVSTLN